MSQRLLNAYGFDKSADTNPSVKDKTVFIFDLGGGTFDVSLLTISGEGTISVKAVGDDTHLGGKDFDKAMVKYCVQEFKRRQKKDLSKNAKAMSKLKVACEKAKRDLPSTTQTTIVLDYLHEGIDFSMKFIRAKFEELKADYFINCIEHVERCLRERNMKKNNVDDVVIVGGSTRIPKLQQMLSDFFGEKPLCKSIKADEAVAYSAIVLAANLSGNHNKGVQKVILADVTPLSLGTNILGGNMSVLIPRNTRIPTFKEHTYHTVYEKQTSIRVGVYQGEGSNINNNILLDKFTLHGVPPAPAGEETIKVCFNIDVNGILYVSAELKSTGKKRSITIARSGKLLTDDVEKMLRKIES